MVDNKNRLRLKKFTYKGTKLQVNTNWRKNVGYRCTVMGKPGAFCDGETVEEAVANCIETWLK